MTTGSRPESTPAAAPRPGGRSARVATAVLRATLEAFAEGGWEAVRIDAIAVRAGVHKTTVYRRWPTRGELIAAALSATPFRSPASIAPDTGSLRGDLETLLAEVEAGMREPRARRISRNLVRAAHVPEMAAAAEEFWRSRITLVTAVITAAMHRGEVGPDVDPDLIATLLIGAIKLHIVDFDNDPPHRWYADLVDATLGAARLPGPPRRVR